MKPKIFAVDIDGTITDNKGGRVDLNALSALRYLVKLGHKVIYVTGRSSIEAYILSVFGGTTRVAVGENGGIITTGPNEHKLIGNKEECIKAFEFLKVKIAGIREKPVFPRRTEVVLERNFDINLGKKILEENNLDAQLSDSQYAYHINSKGINKANGFLEVMRMFSAKKEEVRPYAMISVLGHAGDGIIEALETIQLKLLAE